MIGNTILFVALAACTFAAEKKLELKDLPAAARKTVEEQTKGATIKGIVKEGKSFEVETMVDGKTRDFVVAANGTLDVVEEQTELDAIPAPAKVAILKAVADGKITIVETLKKGSSLSYEAQYMTKAGKKKEVIVTAEGAKAK